MLEGKAEVIVVGLLIVLVTFTGCTGTSNSPTVLPQTTTQIITPNATIPLDPIVGIWTITFTSGVTYSHTFSSDGKYSMVSSKDNTPIKGTWNKLRENQYVVIDPDGSTMSYVFNPDSETLSIPEYPNSVIYRAGKEPKSTYGSSQTSSSNQNGLSTQSSSTSSKLVEITQSSLSERGSAPYNWVEYTGIVKNNDYMTHDITVESDFYDSNKKFLTTKTDYVFNVPAGGERSFTISILDSSLADSIDTGKLRAFIDD
jgi:hypothetical protein